MNNYDCEIVQSRRDGIIKWDEFHLRIRWNSTTAIDDGSTIFWTPRKKGFVRVFGSGENLVISVSVKETYERKILLVKDNVNISPLAKGVKKLKGKFRFNIEKIDGGKKVDEEDFSIEELPVEHSFF